MHEFQDLAARVAGEEFARIKAELRTWTGKNEHVIEAYFVDVSDDGRNVTLRTDDGRIIRTETENLIDADQHLVIKYLVTRCLQKIQHARSNLETGDRYYLGIGVRQDFEVAAGYYRKAAAFGDIVPKSVLDYFGDLAPLLLKPATEANFRLGLMYFSGFGVTATPAERESTVISPDLYRRLQLDRASRDFSLSRDARRAAQQELAALREMERRKQAREKQTERQEHLDKAKYYYRKAAERGHVDAQNNLGLLLEREGNENKALFWYRKAAEANSPEALHNLGFYEQYRGNTALAADYYKRAGATYLEREDREGALRCLDRLQNIGATVLATALADKIYQPAASPTSPPTEDQRVVSMGTGWFCSPRHIVTSWHVLAGKEKFYVSSELYQKIPVRLIVSDRKNDLAILEIPDTGSANPKYLPLAADRVSTGEQVFTVGFPHISFLGKAPKYTEGTVSALSGIGDDPRILQISVPVQSGNSGGPLLNAAGEVVGVVASKLAAARVFEWTGDLPQKVNFAVKVDYLRPILRSRSVNFRTGSDEAKTLSRPDLVKRVEPALVVVTAE